MSRETRNPTPSRPALRGARSARRSAVLWPIWLLAAAVGGGCVMSASPAITSMKHSIERDLGDARFEQEVGITLGRISLGLGKMVANRFDEAREHRELWRGVKKVEVGVYTAARRSRPPRHGADAASRVGDRLESTLRERGWTPAVTIRDGRERVWVYYRANQREDGIRGVYVVALEGDELTLVRLSGRLDQTLRAGIALSRRYADGEDPLT